MRGEKCLRSNWWEPNRGWQLRAAYCETQPSTLSLANQFFQLAVRALALVLRRLPTVGRMAEYRVEGIRQDVDESRDLQKQKRICALGDAERERAASDADGICAQFLNGLQSIFCRGVGDIPWVNPKDLISKGHE
jgi:hypothetical protein